jgi:hypothetical protein
VCFLIIYDYGIPRKWQIFRMFEVVSGEERRGKTQVCGWFSKFECSVTSVQDSKHWGIYKRAKQMKVLIE